jgi:hypothetical protein
MWVLEVMFTLLHTRLNAENLMYLVLLLSTFHRKLYSSTYWVSLGLFGGLAGLFLPSNCTRRIGKNKSAESGKPLGALGNTGVQAIL